MKNSLVSVIVICFFSIEILDAQKINYPPTPKVAVIDDYHGTLVADPYQWLEAIESEKSLSWVGAQNSLSENYLDSLPSRTYFLDRLKELELAKRPKIPRRQWSYWVSRERQENGSDLYLMQDSLFRQTRIILDPDLVFPDKEMKS